MADPVSTTYDFVNGTPADGAEVTQNFDDIEGYLNDRLGAASSAQIWVADSSGKATPKTLSGDATISTAGALSLASNSVGASEIGSLPYAELTKSANQPVAGSPSADSVVEWDTEVADTDSMHDNLVNNTRITMTTAGVYVVSARLFCDPATDWTISLRKNGSQVLAAAPFESVEVLGALTIVMKFAAADYVEVLVGHDSGSNKNVRATGASSGGDTRFSASWMGEG